MTGAKSIAELHKNIKKDIVVCKTQREKEFVEKVMEQPIGCWGDMPTEIMIGEMPEKPAEANHCVYDGELRYIPFPKFMYFWLDDGYNIHSFFTKY